MISKDSGPATGEGAASEPPIAELDRETNGDAGAKTETSPPGESDPIDLDTVRDRAS